jgi:hypothetical protein
MLKPYNKEHEQQMRAFYTSLSEKDKRRYMTLFLDPVMTESLLVIASEKRAIVGKVLLGLIIRF